jgi:hypothetical protein
MADSKRHNGHGESPVSVMREIAGYPINHAWKAAAGASTETGMRTCFFIPRHF